MALLDKPPYMVATVRSTRPPRSCSLVTGRLKVVFDSRQAARAARRQAGHLDCHPYRCYLGDWHLGRRS